ncbi:hypothetical protein WKK05_34880 [Nostoc sp. UHCC 0302]|uniref:hypothetical protein n=1 Tax=Nostoc sp. UHCC 0302 TaxID=3134896 RepID=UPI00311CB84B
MTKIREAIAIFSANIILFSLIILTVRVPANILFELINFNLPSAADEFAQYTREIRIHNLLGTIFDPIYIGAIIHCLWQLKQGRSVKYSQVILVGIQNWGKIFTARFITTFYILLGLIAFIIPGIVLALRYTLIDSIVIIEGYGNSSSLLKRSTHLTTGKRWEISGVVSLFTVATTIITLIVYILGYLIIREYNIFLNIIVSSFLDVIVATYTVIMFLFYWQARNEEQNH